jgi:hypothetical protein
MSTLRRTRKVERANLGMTYITERKEVEFCVRLERVEMVLFELEDASEGFKVRTQMNKRATHIRNRKKFSRLWENIL